MKAFKKTKVIAVFGIASTLAFLLLSLLSPQFIEERVESVFLDFRFHIRNLLRPPAVPENILIVAIDEKSLERYGRWPWSRVRQAQLIGKVLKGRPAVLAVDIFYPEHESRKADAALGAVLKKAKGRVVLAAGFDREKDQPGEAPDFLLDNAITNIKDQSRLADAVTATKRKTSIPAISAQALLGHVFSPADLDGKLRWEVLSLKYRDDLYPSLSLMTAARALGKGLEDITLYAGRGVSLGDTFIPADGSGRMRIDFLGDEGTFPYISAADVLSGAFNPSGFRNKIVFLGTSAISTFDFAVTPFSARMPGVEKNATIVENILNGRFIRDVPRSVTALVIIATGFLLSFLLPRLRAIAGIVLSLGLLAAFAVLNQYLFGSRGLYVNFVYPFSNLLFITAFTSVYKYLVEERRSREIRKMFSHYVSPKIVDQLIAHPELAKLGGYRKEITVLFSDVRGFTTFSEQRKPEEVVEHLNEYLHEMTDIIFKWDGTLDKFVGDEIMAFWGAPLDQPDHAELAVKCALNMADRLEQLQEKWKAEGKYPLDNGIGINTGDVLVGNIGSADKKMDYTIIGDHVNLGARVETLTRKYDSRVLFTEFTYAKIEHLVREGKLYRVDMKEMDTVKVKGKDIPVKIYGIHSVGTPPE
ncbi:MAG TPA: adenylate/guanylate cyclase domain-containing protein [Nitrospirota bacterium]|nr:adenylate/guanylate cyclase domain-containing protein [Nitrospirota bacterium]